MQRIHIVGYGPRTGTTLLMEMMIACFDIDMFNRHEQRVTRLPRRDAEVFLTKAPADLFVSRSLLRLMKNFHLICMVRDPRDVIVSFHGLDSQHYWAELNFWKLSAAAAAPLQHHPRYHAIRYEDLVRDPDAVQDGLQKAMPFLRRRLPFSRFHEQARPSDGSLQAMRGLRPVKDDSVGNWRHHLPRIVGQIEKHGGMTEDLISHGYESDASWEKQLAGVDPDRSPSVLSDEFSRGYTRRGRRFHHVKAIGVAVAHLPWVLRLQSWLLPERANADGRL